MENREDITRILNTNQNYITTEDITIIERFLNNYHPNFILNDEYDDLYYHLRDIYFDYLNQTEPTTEDEQTNQINKYKTFKTEECVICLTNQPNVLFCNCGHLCTCDECDEIKSLSICPICKTENTIKRII